MKCKGIKNAIKAVAFLLVFALLFSVVQDVLIKRNPQDAQFIPQFYDEPKNSLDAVYIGSSNCFTFWNSTVAWEEYGISVYPYSCNSMPFFAVKHLIKEAHKTQEKATFIVNINSITDDRISIDSMHYLLDVMPFSLNKLSLIHCMSEIGGYSWKDRMEYYLPVIRFHSRTGELKPSDFVTEPDGLKGSTTYSAYLNKSADVSADYVATDERVELSQTTIDYVNDMLDYCDSEQIEVLFVAVPQAKKNLDKIRRCNALGDLIESRGYTVLNLMEKSDEIGIDLTKDLYNGGHTNIHGSIKYTHYLSQILIEKYGFTDKRENSDYQSWNVTEEKYLDIVDSKILDVELDSIHRDFSLDLPKFKTASGKKQVTLTWNAVDGADGYAVYRKTGSSGAWERMDTTQECQFIDGNVKSKTTYYYAVVPYSVKDGENYYGNYKYNGVKVSL